MDDRNQANAQEVLAKIESFSDRYRDIAKRMHELITQTAPELYPRLWYGMPGYSLKSGSAVVLFFREDEYISFGITDSTPLSAFGDPEAGLVPVAWYLSKLDAATEAQVTEIVKKVTDS